MIPVFNRPLHVQGAIRQDRAVELAAFRAVCQVRLDAALLILILIVVILVVVFCARRASPGIL